MPTLIKDKFKADFPGAEVKRWNDITLKGNKIYQVKFSDQGVKKEMEYTSTASPWRLEIEYEPNQVPEAYTSQIRNEFKGFNIDKCKYLKDYEKDSLTIELWLSRDHISLKAMVKLNGDPDDSRYK